MSVPTFITLVLYMMVLAYMDQKGWLSNQNGLRPWSGAHRSMDGRAANSQDLSLLKALKACGRILFLPLRYPRLGTEIVRAGVRLACRKVFGMTETTVFRDFTVKRRRIHFVIDGEEFDARKALSVAKLQAAMTKFRSAQGEVEAVTADTILEKLSGALELVLKPESYQRFIIMMNDEDRDEPIDVPQLMDIFQWLIGQYSVRPTEALPDSSTSSETDNAGTDSPAGAPHQVSTP